MSILKADLLQNRAGTRPPVVTAGDFVKAWFYVNQIPAGQSISGSFGISSITDAAVGTTAPNFTLPFTSAVYVGSLTGQVVATFANRSVDIYGMQATTCNLRHGENNVLADTSVLLGTLAGVQ